MGSEGEEKETIHPSDNAYNGGCSTQETRNGEREREQGDVGEVSKLISADCRTFLLTQAANLAHPQVTEHIGHSESYGNKVTPPTAAMEAPSSPPTSSVETAAVFATSPTSPSPKADRSRGVPHVYRDFSDVPDAAGYVRKKTGGVTQPFPEKLHEMLDRVNEPSTVGWLPHGRAFLVKKPREFTDIIMPRYFRQTKLTSFQRQLNLYGFRRLTQGSDAGAYYHELFLRGRPQLCFRMQRQKVKGTGHKQPADAKTEPNFYSMVPSQASPPLVARPFSTMKTNAAISATTYEALSPGMQGLHGAANLLKNISSGFSSSPSPIITSTPFSLGASAMRAASTTRRKTDDGELYPSTVPHCIEKSSGDDSKPAAQTKMTTPLVDGSMSLLGRVHLASSPTSAGSAQFTTAAPQSIFFWPPGLPSMKKNRESSQASSQEDSSKSGSSVRDEAKSSLPQDSKKDESFTNDTTSDGLMTTSSHILKEESIERSGPKGQGRLDEQTSESGGPMEAMATNGIETTEV